MEIENEVVLVFAPHTDDAEFGCGGTIAKFLENGCDIHVASFSFCEESVPIGFPKDALKWEFINSIKSFGVPEDRIHVYNFPVRRFNEHRQNILEAMIKLRNVVNPSIIIAPSLNDVHQDHNCIGNEVIRAFKNRTIFAYEMPWNHLRFDNTLFVKLDRRHVEAKLKALSNYKTQTFRKYADPEVVLAQARCRGVQCGMEYAEMFEVVRCYL